MSPEGPTAQQLHLQLQQQQQQQQHHQQQQQQQQQQQRAVVRAACLSCRSAKRRCDGVMPVCGPCASRGVEQGGCNFVSSKRGGPRYKGVKGADAAKLKADKDKQKELARSTKDRYSGGHRLSGSTVDGSDRDREGSFQRSSISSSNGMNGAFGNSHPHKNFQRNGSVGSSSNGSAMSSIHRNRSSSPRSAQSDGQHAQSSHSASFDEGINHTPPSPFVTTPVVPTMLPSSSIATLPTQQQHHHQQQQHYQQPHYHNHHHQQQQQQLYQHNRPFDQQQQQQQQQQQLNDNLIGFNQASAQQLLHQQPQPQPQPQQQRPDVPLYASHQLPHESVYSFDNTEFGQGALSFANLELWQRMQDDQTASESSAFADFYSRLETLPKAGLPGAIDPTGLDLWMNWEDGDLTPNVQNNEQSVRSLLGDFYEFVYPACPVLLPPGSLPSLAFYFSGKGPCGLFAAISACVSLHLPPDDAQKTLRTSYGGDALACAVMPMADESTLSNEVAAMHANTSENILYRYAQSQQTCFATPLEQSANGTEELVQIEAAAAHTLLCHFYYGSGKPGSHERAYMHALEAWNGIQKYDLPRRCHPQNSQASQHQPLPNRPFTPDLMLEWAKRVYWCSYAAATVMSCTGGFQPFAAPRDGVLDLQMRPQLDQDVAAWGTMIRGAQQVSQAYRLLYDLDQLRTRMASVDPSSVSDSLSQDVAERQRIFNAMLKLDSEIDTYTRFDPYWRKGFILEDSVTEGIEPSEVNLAHSLHIAGRLMCGGSMIILHRAQAFSNARVFMSPQCGIPEAARIHDMDRAVEPIMHRAPAHDRADASGASPGSRNTTTSHALLNDKFAVGPFEPALSLERCRFAASAMISTVPHVLHETASGRSPKLPPYSACSYVIGAYATLMITLLIQVQGQRLMLQQQSDLASRDNDEAMDGGAHLDKAQLQRQLEAHRAPVRDMIVILKRFSTVWAKAVDYEDEVATLLAANETIR